VPNRDELLVFLGDLIDVLHDQQDNPPLQRLFLRADSLYARLREEQDGRPWIDYVNDVVEDRIQFELATQDDPAAA
jgi:hypothetical protein